MKNYDFTQDLSPIDFELLVKDILESEMEIKFENFRDGKDGGIDLRHTSSVRGSGQIIIQCKRYASHSFTTLFSHLKTKELPKIKKLNAARYILCTSVSLSPQQADELVVLLSPHLKSSEDVYGKERLNALLSSFPEVERRHIKLWIGNAGMLEELIAPRGRFISQEEITKASRSARVYVHNDSLKRAQELLNKESICVISGNPGIGKTTLAHMLMLSYLKRNYEIVKIESDIDEGTCPTNSQ